jgi:glycosyltransferase involved in cell wall biosynthesis
VIRVLEVLATLKRAGAENMVVSLASRLDRRHFAPAVVSLFDAFPNGLEPELERAGLPFWHLGKRPGFDPRMYTRLQEVVRSFRPDIIHTHSYVMRYTLPLRARSRVHTVHNVAAREVDRIGRLVHRLGFRLGVVPVAVADEVARSFEAVYGRHPAAVIRNGIDVERFQTSGARQRWRAEHGFMADDVLIVSVARLDPQKNPLGLVEAFTRVAPRAHLVLAGEGSLRTALTGRDRVHLVGVRSDLPELLSAADIFALSSDWEGYPISVMEAMAAGLPVVATAVGGVPEMVGDAGRLVPQGDMPAFSERLAELVANDSLRQELSAAARRRAAAFDVRYMVEAYEALFTRLAG